MKQMKHGILITGFWLGAMLPVLGQFSRSYGGNLDEHALTLVSARDGGAVMAGFTYSFGAGKSDVWVLKVDEWGEELWRKTLGGPGFDWASDLIETRDGNYVVAGFTRDSLGAPSDAWVFQINRYGELMWSRTYGGPRADEARALVQTSDGGFAVTGFSYSFARGESDIWLLRLNAVGEQLWERSYGGSGTEQASDIAETSDEGFLLGGYQSYGEPNRADMLLVKVDRNGKGIWRKSLPAPGNGVAEAVCESPDGRYMAAGWRANGESNRLDAVLACFSKSGQLLWEKTYGGPGKEAFYDLIASGSGFVAAGEAGGAWMLATDKNGTQLRQQVTQGPEQAHALAALRGGGYLLAGARRNTGSGSDFLLIRSDAAGRFAPETEATPTATQLPPPTGAGRTWVIAIGISDYPDSIPDLNFAHSDAARLGQALARCQTQLGQRTELRVLQNEQAHLVEIQQALAEADSQAGPGDQVLVFFAGHGVLDADGQLYLLPSDCQPGHWAGTALTVADLAGQGPARRLLMLDACHSGQSGLNVLASVQASGANVTDAAKSLGRRNLAVMAASGDQEFSYERDTWEGGAFTRALTEALAGSADLDQDQEVTLLEAHLYCTRRVKALTQNRQSPSLPVNLLGDPVLSKRE